MAESQEQKESKDKEGEETTTVHVSEESKKKFPSRTILVYLLLLAAGLFIGIVFRLATR